MRPFSLQWVCLGNPTHIASPLSRACTRRMIQVNQIDGFDLACRRKQSYDLLALEISPRHAA